MRAIVPSASRANGKRGLRGVPGTPFSQPGVARDAAANPGARRAVMAP